jgi:hypothetical protein
MQNLPAIIDPQPFRVTACPHPFREANETRSMPPGVSLAQVLRAVQPDAELRRFGYVWVNDEPVPPAAWETTFPEAGAKIDIRVAPGGGAGRIIGTIFLAIAAIVVSVLTYGALAGPAWGVWAGVVAGLAGMTVSIVGNMVLNAMFPATANPARQAALMGTGAMASIGYGGSVSSSPTYSLNGGSNQANKYGPIPKIFGIHKHFPNYGADTYTEILGEDQYLHLYFVWAISRSDGPGLRIQDLKIGETSIEEFEGVEIEHRNLELYLYGQTITIDVVAKTLTRTTGSWLSDGIKAGITLTLGGCTTAGNNTGYLISEVTALVLTYTTGTAATSEAGNGAQTATIIFGNEPFILYTNNVYEDGTVKQILLEQGAPVVRTSQAGPRWLSIDISLPSLFANDPTSGARGSKTVVLKIEYRLSGSDGPWIIPLSFSYDTITSVWVDTSYTWTVGNYPVPPGYQLKAGIFGFMYAICPDGSNIPMGTTVTISRGYWSSSTDTTSGPGVAITAASNTAVRRGYRWEVNPGADPEAIYDVRVTRVSPGADDTFSSSVSYWTAFRSIWNISPFQPPVPCATTVMRIKASNELSGTVDRYSGICSGIEPDWDAGTSTWITRITQNPASHLREHCQGPQNMDPYANSELDLAKLAYFHAYCITQGWQYNKIVDYTVDWEELWAEIAAAGRGALDWLDSVRSVIIDEPQPFTIGPAFTPRNSKGYSFQIVYPDVVHCWRCAFKNELNDWSDDERLVLLDGYALLDANGDKVDAWGDLAPTLPLATIFVSLPILGVTHPDLIFKHARFHGVQLQLRYIKHQFDAHLDQMVARRGNRFKFSQDVILAGSSWGRVKSLIMETMGYEEVLLYPPAQSDTYVKATSKYSTSYWPYFATDPLLSLIGNQLSNSWLAVAGVNANQRFNIDLGTPKTVTQINYENFHNSGANITAGVKNFTLWGSNTATFGNVTWVSDAQMVIDGWTKLACDVDQFAEHVAANTVDPHLIVVTNITAFRYYSFKFVDNWGMASFIGIRRIVLQELGDLIYSGNLGGVTLDAECPMIEGTEYTIRFRLGNNVSVLCNVVAAPGTPKELTFVDAIPPYDPGPPPENYWPAVGDLFMFGERGKEAVDLLLDSLRPNNNLGAKITAVTYDEAIYDADVGEVPVHVPQVTIPPAWWTPAVAWVRSDGTVLWRNSDGTLSSRILISLRIPGALNANVTGIEAQYWATGSAIAPTTMAVVPLRDWEVSLEPVEDGLSYDFRLRYVKMDGSRGPWSATVTHVVEGKSAPPENPAVLYVDQVKEVINFTWPQNPDLDLAGYDLRYGPVGCTVAEGMSLTEIIRSTSFATPMVPPGVWDFLLRAVDTSGNYSLLEARKTFQVVQFYQVLSQTPDFPLWGGTLANYFRNPNSGYLIPADQDLASGNNFNVFDNFVVTPYAVSSYETPEIDLTGGGDVTARAWARIVTNLGPGESGTVEPKLQFDFKPDGGSYGGFADWTIGAFSGRYVKFRLVATAADGLRRVTDFQGVIDKSY